MKKEAMIVLILIGLVLFGASCANPVAIARSNKEIKEFMKDYPNADLKIIHLTSEQAETVLEDIKEICGEQMLAKEYYQITINDAESGLGVIGYIDAEKQIVECVVKKGIVPEEKKPEPEVPEILIPPSPPPEENITPGLASPLVEENVMAGAIANPPTRDSPITITPSKIELSGGEDAEIKVAFVNPSSTKTYSLQVLQETAETCASGGSECDINPIYNEEKFKMEKDQINVWTIKISPKYTGTGGNPIVRLYTVRMYAGGVDYRKDFVVTIKGSAAQTKQVCKEIPYTEPEEYVIQEPYYVEVIKDINGNEVKDIVITEYKDVTIKDEPCTPSVTFYNPNDVNVDISLEFVVHTMWMVTTGTWAPERFYCDGCVGFTKGNVFDRITIAAKSTKEIKGEFPERPTNKGMCFVERDTITSSIIPSDFVVVKYEERFKEVVKERTVTKYKTVCEGETQVETAPSKIHIVEIKDVKFYPEELTINTGDTIVWVNKEDAPHLVYEPHNLFRSPKLVLGDSFSFTFTQAGEYIYSDSIFAKTMRGKIIVKASPSITGDVILETKAGKTGAGIVTFLVLIFVITVTYFSLRGENK